MSGETILKKDTVYLRKSLLKMIKGDLVLTSKELFFIHKKGFIKKADEKLVSINIADIINVQPSKPFSGYGLDRLEILYRSNSKEIKVKFDHTSIYGWAAGRLNAGQPLYFADWARVIDDLRFSKNQSNSNGLTDLEQLAKLKMMGVITEDEFKAKKKQILGI